MKQMKIRIPEATHQSLKLLCVESKVSMQDFILVMLFDFLDRIEKEKG